MSQIIEHSSGEENVERINIGEKLPSVTIKEYQAIYHQITGRTEQIRKRYRELFLIDFNEIKQLHIKINQLQDVHKVAAQNLTVSIFHEQERKEQFTSFERFETYNTNNTKPTLSVVLKYNFSIIPAGLDKAQEYSISIRLNSKIALQKEMEEEAPPFMRGRFFGILEPIAEITVDYVDYIIARGFIESFDEWANGCKRTKPNKCIQKLQEYSSLIPILLFISSICLMTYLALQAIPNYVKDLQSMLRMSVIFINGGILVIYLNTFIGSRLERFIDSYPYLSYVHMNRGDQNLIDDFKTKQNSSVRASIFFIIINVILNIAATKLEKLI